MLRIEKIHKNYPVPDKEPLHVLRGVTLEIEPVQSISIQGPSGCGKSTLLHVMGLLDRPTSGSIFFEDRNLLEWNRSNAAIWRGKHLGFVFQTYHLIPELTALENVMLPGLILGQKMMKEATDWLHRVGLSERANHLPRQLSGGEQQRVAIARALINQPEIILADEPTGNLDEKSGTEIADLLLDLVAENKKSLVLVTHDPALAARAGRRLRLTEGQLENV